MSYRLVILGLLAEQPRYGYELKQAIEERSFARYVPLSGGGLYYNLRKLHEEGYLVEQTVEREGNYPDRHIYAITDEGRAYFLDLLRATFDDVAARRIYDPIDAALAFGGLLPPQEVVARLRHRIERVRAILAELDALQDLNTRLADYIGVYHRLIVDRTVYRISTSMAWMEHAIREIEAQAAPVVPGGAPRSDGLAPPAAPPSPELVEAATQAQAAHARLLEASAAYSGRVEQLWREYDAQLKAAPADSAALSAAHAAYRHGLDAAWRKYETQLTAAHERVDSLLPDLAAPVSEQVAQTDREPSSDLATEP